MIEKVLLDYLNDSLSEPVYMERQKDEVVPFVVIEKTGGGGENFIKSSTFAIQSYGKSMLKAAQLNEAVKEAMEGFIELDEITKVDLDTDYNYTDTNEKIYRYQAVYNIKHY